MFTLFVLYAQPDDPEAFDKYYREIHAPLAQKIPGLRRFEATTIAATPDGSPSPYHLVATLAFDTQEDAQAGLESPEGQAAVQDVANFATGGITGLLGTTQSLT